MISYTQFKELLNKIEPNTELEILFKNISNKYMIIKYENNYTFQRCGSLEEQSGEMPFDSLEAILTTKTIDDINIKDNWNNIKDIVINYTYSIVDDKDELLDQYNIKD
jgi:hypothetical protein